MPDGEEIYVEADSETEARQAAREQLGVDRLPNHTTATPME
jgi:hypothetical protein